MKLLSVMKRKAVFDLMAVEFAEFAGKILSEEFVVIELAVGRTLSRDICAKEAVPNFRRSTVDGYAVRSKDTEGCSEAIPAFLNVVGCSVMGEETTFTVEMGCAVYVPTGGMVPEGADAIVMIEYTEVMGDEIAVYQPAAPRENIVEIGDDARVGEVLLSNRQVIGAHHLGILGILGHSAVPVLARPKITIISTGDELVDIKENPSVGQVRDVNTLMLAAFAEKLGCEVVAKQRIVDDKIKIRESLLWAVENSDVVVISGGSSVGDQDCTAELINTLGLPGVLVHGVAIKPGKPTIVARVKDKAIFGLPGHPAACIVSFQAIVAPFINSVLFGNDSENIEKKAVISAKSGFQISFGQGRDVFQMVTVKKEVGGYVAYPVYGKSGMLSLLSQAEGYVEIPMEKESIGIGEDIMVKLF